MNDRDRYWLGRYGPWALVCGGSEGIGAAFATALADAGLNLVLVARRLEPLEALAETLKNPPPVKPPARSRARNLSRSGGSTSGASTSGASTSGVSTSGVSTSGVSTSGASTTGSLPGRSVSASLGSDGSRDRPSESDERLDPPDPLVTSAPGAPPARDIAIRTVVADLASPGGFYSVRSATADLEIGLVVANAAYAPVGAFLDIEVDNLISAIDVNCSTTVRLARHFLPPMAQRRRGGLIIMSSAAGNQGSPGLATYAATKAFDAVLAEGLWAEMRPLGVDVITCVPGAVSTPGLARSKGRRAPGTVSPEAVAKAGLAALGHRPRTVPGLFMKFSSAVMQRLMPKRSAITLIAKASRDVH